MIRSLLPLPFLLCAAALVVPVPAAAQTEDASVTPATTQYLALRRVSPPLSIPLSELAQNPAGYRGRTLEVEGKLVGICSGDEGLTRLMLLSDNAGSLSLTMSHVPEWVRAGSRIRVLIIVTAAPNEPSTVELGIPEMEVVAVASAWDLQALEERARMSAATRAAYDAAARRATAARRRQQGAGKVALERPMPAARYAPGPTPTGGLSRNAQAVFASYRAFIRERNTRLTEAQVSDITWAVLRYSEALDTDPRLVIALIIAESDFDPRSTSNKGAMGLGQIMPDEAHDLGGKIGLNNPYDPVQNVAGSIYLLRTHLARYAGGKAMNAMHWNEISLALAAYNAGPGAVKRYGGIPPYRETQNYVRKIAAIYRQLCGDAG